MPGTVRDAEIGDENGYMVWEIGVAANDGSFQEVGSSRALDPPGTLIAA